MKLKCPICGKECREEEHGYRCVNNHSFDKSREGYVNLLRKQKKKEYGDSVAQVDARRAFFLKDFYAPLKTAVTQALKDYEVKHAVDAGCGEGYYTNFFKEEIPELDLLGVDISKEAVRLASRHSKAQYAVCGVDALPVFDRSLDAVLNLFAPIAEKEYLRTLKKDGNVIYVQVGKDHLLQLKEELYETVYRNEINYLSEQFVLKEERNVGFEIDVKQEDLWNLFQMTPYYFHTPLSAKEHLKEVKELRIHCEFVIQIYWIANM